MFRNASLAFIAALVVAAPTVSVAQEMPHKRIIVDNSAECGNYRYAMHRRQDNETAARRLASKLNAAGYKTTIVVINPGQLIGAADIQTGNVAPIFKMNC